MLDGQCLCGSVRFQLEGKLPGLYQCHCSLCRKLSGSASDTAMFLNKAQFKWLSGETLITSYRTPKDYRSDFCQTCGNTVPHLMNNQQQYWVPAGLLENTDNTCVKAQLYVDSKADWDTLSDAGEKFADMPDMATLNKLLQE